MSSPTHVNFDLEAGQSATVTSGNFSNQNTPSSRSEPDLSKTPSPILKRRQTRSRSNTNFTTVDVFPSRPNWRPGQEPGLDTSKPNGGRSQKPTLHEECQITVVDYSEDEMVMHDFDNEQLISFLDQKQESWISCRWINVNGLSWDVIQALGNHKKLHRLAIEDLMNTNNRTKADWYTDHTYMVLTLQKLVHLHADEASDSDDDDTDSTFGSTKAKRGPISKFFHKLFSSSKVKEKYHEKQENSIIAGVHNPSKEFVRAHTDGVIGAPIQKLRTLQRYRGGPNNERMEYMERHSPLTRRKLAVSAEQVSIFLMNDNTVISFFESSADDIEAPILHRLSTPDTILRRSCDASMLTQAIIDAIIDLAMPVSTAYQDVIGELELNVLTEPSIKHTTTLYVVTSEITMMRNFVSPIVNLINALRDHKSSAMTAIGPGDLKRSQTSVKISPMAQTYLGDVEDHIILITESLDQMRRSCDNMIDLIFNTVSAYQNESMKQLTVVTIIFLPLTFLTGYFGMNITNFPSIHHNESYFWIIACPLAVAVTLFMLRDILKWWFMNLLQRRGISRSRKGRLMREAKTMEKPPVVTDRNVQQVNRPRAPPSTDRNSSRAYNQEHSPRRIHTFSHRKRTLAESSSSLIRPIRTQATKIALAKQPHFRHRLPHLQEMDSTLPQIESFDFDRLDLKAFEHTVAYLKANPEPRPLDFALMGYGSYSAMLEDAMGGVDWMGESIAVDEGDQSSVVETSKKTTQSDMSNTPKFAISKAIVCSWINCNVELFNDAEHIAHLESHANDVIQKWDTPSRCLWEGCRSKAMFKSSQAYRHHLTNIHTNPLVCDDAGCTYKKPFRNGADLKRHKITAHSANKPFQCPYGSCQADVRTFVRKDKLLKHIQEIQHENDAFCPKPHCAFAHRSRYTGFSDRKAISAHFSRYHTLLREGGYECSLGKCAESNNYGDWKNTWGMEEHLRHHHGIPLNVGKAIQHVTLRLARKLRLDGGKTFLLAHLQELEQEFGCKIPWNDCQICEHKEIGTLDNGGMEY